MIAGQHSLSESHLAIPEAVPLIRRSVANLAATAGLDGPQLDSLKLAVSEAVTNVVLHAYRDVPGFVHITAWALDKEFWVMIADEGCGYNTPPSHPGLGWGLAVITDSSDEFTLLERADGGTEARMLFRLSKQRPALRSVDQ